MKNRRRRGMTRGPPGAAQHDLPGGVPPGGGDEQGLRTTKLAWNKELRRHSWTDSVPRQRKSLGDNDLGVRKPCGDEPLPVWLSLGFARSNGGRPCCPSTAPLIPSLRDSLTKPSGGTPPRGSRLRCRLAGGKSP